jgi:hypothetical protein
MVCIDLKQDVIEYCTVVANRIGFDEMEFICMDIKKYQMVNKPHLVISLHACDIATDYALYNAIRWNAKVILSVPCCQHELNNQIKSKKYTALTEFGIVKERMSALMTDVTRAKLLQIEGYKTQLLEFIDMEHTPKNILIRAIKRDRNINMKKAKQDLENLKSEFNYELTLEKLLNNKE